MLNRLIHAVVDATCAVGQLTYAPIRRRRQKELRSAPNMARILVFNEVRGLGNLVLLSGLLLNLRRFYPHSRITVAMPESPVASEILASSLVDEFLFFDIPNDYRRTLLHFAWTKLRPRAFDLGLATFFSPTVLASSVLLLAGCRYRIAFAQHPHRGFWNTFTLHDTGGHELDRHLRLLHFVDCPPDRRTILSLPPHVAGEAIHFLTDRSLGIQRPLLGVHPGCDRMNLLKRWPLERFLSTVRVIAKARVADILVFLGPDESDLATAFASRLPPQVAIVQEKDLALVAGLIARCTAFLSNDSGLMHVAAALGVSVVAIFGPTGTEKNAPAGKARLLTALNVPCRPCYSAPPIRCIHDRRYCLEHISVDEVLVAVTAALKENVTAAAGDLGRSDLDPVGHVA